MSDLNSTTKNIQRAVGVRVDGIFGPMTAAAVMRALNAADGIEESATAEVIGDEWKAGLDARTIKNIETLDAKAREDFAEFTRLAKATAATLGCDYVMIGGNRTYDEQDKLYELGRVTGGQKVTNAKGGQSNHNFAIAGDFGVFRGKAYLDNSNPSLAAKVHRACSEHAAVCGMEWGGSWRSFKDLPHYEIKTGLTMAQKRKLMKEKGSVL